MEVPEHRAHKNWNYRTEHDDTRKPAEKFQEEWGVTYVEIRKDQDCNERDNAN